jgi:hypothetical protein
MYNDYYKNLNTGSKCCSLARSGITGPTGAPGSIGPTGPAGVSVSDERDKTDIAPLEPSLSFLCKLKPVRFNWNIRKPCDPAIQGQPEVGFIAQQLLSAQIDTAITVPGLVDDTDAEYLLADYKKLIPIIVSAIQELEERTRPPTSSSS